MKTILTNAALVLLVAAAAFALNLLMGSSPATRPAPPEPAERITTADIAIGRSRLIVHPEVFKTDDGATCASCTPAVAGRLTIAGITRQGGKEILHLGYEEPRGMEQFTSNWQNCPSPNRFVATPAEYWRATNYWKTDFGEK